MKILIVDDDCALLQQLQSALEGQRYLVETASDGDEAMKKLLENSFDLVILDIMMPGLDGLSVLRESREEGLRTPMLVLSAKGDTDDRVRGLDLGADDYLAKPFSLNELFARIRALLRRAGGSGDSVLRVGDISLDTAARTVSRSGAAVELTPKEFAILEFLMYNRNRVVSRLNLAEHVWRDDFDPFSMSNFMDVHIKNIRQKMNDNSKDGILRTVRGVGYILKDNVP
ncbi:MAG: response regulator transcription factor [Synergistaceae bacterium]|jgi:DNA-binding response OmpR family regulator|nr:response regulator transcription factor [Synergistaceae bacterium]